MSGPSTFTPTGALELGASELQSNLEELGNRPVGPIVFVNSCIVFDIIFVVGNRSKSDLLG